MKKIMFNDKYGLTQAVLDGRKTMTRREIKNGVIKDYLMNQWWFRQSHINNRIRRFARYQVGEVVAIAQSYDTIFKEESLYKKKKKNELINILRAEIITKSRAGWNNKMFVRAGELPHHIRITNISIERLQDISDEDCLKEGIKEDWSGFVVGNTTYKDIRCAYSALIDKVSGKGTWNRNPWVFVYEFELID